MKTLLKIPCRRCGEHKSVTEFFPSFLKRDDGRVIHGSRCITCCRELARQTLSRQPLWRRKQRSKRYGELRTKARRVTLSAHELRKIVSYDTATGVFSWNRSMGLRAPKGTKAGWTAGGRTTIQIRYKRYKAARLAWLLVVGEFPRRRVDHIDRDATNNRWSNLRLASTSQNAANSKLRSDNTTGFKGVYRTPYKWTSFIKVMGKQIHLGNFDTALDAAKAYKRASRRYFGKFAHTPNL